MVGTSFRRRLMMAIYRGSVPPPPVGYTKYLQGVGGGYIDTGISQLAVGRLELAFQVPKYQLTSQWQIIAGGRSFYYSSDALAFYWNAQTKYIGASIGGRYEDFAFPGIVPGAEHTFVWDYTTGKALLDGVEASGTFPTPSGTSYNFRLFGVSSSPNEPFPGLIRYCRLWDRNGVKVWDGTAYYQAGQAAFYDSVSHTLFTPTGVVLPVAETPSTGLHFFDYLYTDAEAYIDTGLDLSGAPFSISGSFLRFFNGGEQVIASTYAYPPDYWSLLIQNNLQRTGLWVGSMIDLSGYTPAIGELVPFSLEWDNGSYTLVASGISDSRMQANANPQNVLLFRQPIPNNNSAIIAAAGEWVFSKNGVVVRRMRPCSYNGEAGMWDSINDVFYGNANNTGVFKVG